MLRIFRWKSCGCCSGNWLPDLRNNDITEERFGAWAAFCSQHAYESLDLYCGCSVSYSKRRPVAPLTRVMGFTKFTGSEKTEVLSPAQHQAAGDALKRLGKTSARDLSEDERRDLQKSISSRS